MKNQFLLIGAATWMKDSVKASAECRDFAHVVEMLEFYAEMDPSFPEWIINVIEL